MASLLAFDTATEHLSVALRVGGRSWLHDGAGGAQASAALLPAIRRLLDEAGIGLRQLDAIAFGRGPGAFTGLRTACSVAQGLAFGADRPVLAIDTLLAVAEDARQHASAAAVAADSARAGSGEDAVAWSCWVAMDARMGEIYAAHYAFDAAGWRRRAAPLLLSPDALNERWQSASPHALAGSAIAAFGDQLQAGDAWRCGGALPTARALLPLADALWARGGAVDAAQALPLYLRDRVAQTTAERAASRLAAPQPSLSRSLPLPPSPNGRPGVR